MNHQRFIPGPLTLVALAACGGDAPEPQTAADTDQPPAEMARQAEVELEAAEGSDLEGKATLKEDMGGVRIILTVAQASAGEKGVHIHQIGDCSDIAGKSMGEHFSPDAHQHALPAEATTGERHLGDMGNIRVNDDGEGKLEFVIDRASLREGDQNSLIGRALVVHENQDQGAAEQPSGASGKPIACGVIEGS